MNTLVTLLGGLLLMLIVYGALGWLPGLPQVLRAVLASSLTLIAYFAFMVGRSPGLDVLAVHISIFAVAGLLLYMFTRYRSHRAARLHWAPRILIGFFVMLAVINTFFLYISSRGLPPSIAHYWLPGNDTVYSGFSGVVEHGQDAAKAVSSELKRAQTAAQLGWHIRITGLPQTTRSQQIVTVQVLDRSDMPVNNLQAELQLMRPGADHAHTKITLTPKEPGEYSNVLALPANGRWLVDVQFSQGGRVAHRESVEINVP